MTYENPKIPEGINYSREHPLKEFAWLIFGVSIILILLVSLLSISLQWLAPKIPFRYEEKISEVFANSFTGEKSDEHLKKEHYLNELAQKLMANVELKLPQDMKYYIHYSESESVNAITTLGGHIVIFSGLIDKLPNENALAMVIAHELAHVIHRDPIVALGRGTVISLVLSGLFGTDGSSATQAFNQLGLLTLLSFNREQEKSADALALNMLKKTYGHTQGAESLFEILNQEEHSNFEIFQSHPLTEKRIKRIKQSQTSSGLLTEMPIDFVSK